jgi:hypothetical protein
LITSAAIDNPLGHFRLIRKFGDGMLHNLRLGRVQNDKLVWVKGGPQSVGSGELSAAAELVHNLLAAWEVAQIIADLWMSLDREDLAIDAKAPDAVARAVVQGFQQRMGIAQADVRQLGETLMLTELLHGRSGGRAELDRLVSEDAAQPHADHVD